MAGRSDDSLAEIFSHTCDCKFMGGHNDFVVQHLRNLDDTLNTIADGARSAFINGTGADGLLATMQVPPLALVCTIHSYAVKTQRPSVSDEQGLHMFSRRAHHA